MSKTKTHKILIRSYGEGTLSRRRDVLAVEEPLELRVLAGAERRTLGITMRTPGADFELAAGFALSEGIVSDLEQIEGMSYCVDRQQCEEQNFNIVNIWLRATRLPDLDDVERRFSAGSACGICGTASLDALERRGHTVLPDGPQLDSEIICSLPEQLRSAQGIFDATGGLHAAALFDIRGNLLALREDIGRHNALDKVLGWALLQRKLPLQHTIVLLSGRASYELVQKALVAGAPIVCAISAPSSLAVSTARRFGMTLVGFLRGSRFNIYSGAERLIQGIKDEG